MSSAPTFLQSISPSTIGPGAVATATFTIDNTANGTPVTDLAFTDVLPVGVILATPSSASTSCTGATLSAPAGGGTLTFSDASVGGSSSCTVQADITSTVPGVHSNLTGDLTSSEGNSGTSTADLAVVTTLPGFAKSFAPSAVDPGETSTLTFTINNALNAAAVPNLDFTDNMPTGMEVASPSNASTDCISTLNDTTLTATPGGQVITLNANGAAVAGFEVLAAGASCTVTVDILATGVGDLNNVSGPLLANFVSAGVASDTLTVNLPTGDPLISKSFGTNPVAAGATTSLDFTIENTDRNFSATGVGFTDDLSAMLASTLFTSLNSNDCGGSVSGVGTSLITFSGGTIAPEGSCDISVTLTIPAAAPTATVTNNTSAVTATIDGSPSTGNVATANLNVNAVTALPPNLALTATDGVPGGDITVTFDFDNPATGPATDLEVLMVLQPPLAFPAVVTLPPLPCGAGSSVALVFIDTEVQGLELTGGDLAAGGSCGFDVTITLPPDMTSGGYSFTTGAPTATVGGASQTGLPASDGFTVGGGVAVDLTKDFDVTIAPPSTTVGLDFTITNQAESDGTATAISFTDDLDAFLTGTVLTSVDSNTCSGSSVTGTDTISVSGFDLAQGASCTIETTITLGGGTGTDITNTTSQPSAGLNGGTPDVVGAAAEADLTVTSIFPLEFSKEFLNDPVVAGDTVTLRFSMTNPNATDDATAILFTDNLSATLTGLAANAVPTVDTCGGTPSGTTFLNYVGGSLLGGASCTIEYTVTVPVGTADGNYGNTTSNLTATIAAATQTSDPATDTLEVQSVILNFSKEFTDDPTLAGGTASLVFTIENLSADTVSAITFDDDLDAMLTGASGAGVSSTCGGMGSDGTTFSYSGGSLTAGSSCTVTVDVSIPGGAVAGTYPNMSNDVAGMANGFAVSGDPATDDLAVLTSTPPTFTKQFLTDPVSQGGATTLRFTIDNPVAGGPLTNLAFSDDLDALVSGMTVSSLPPANPCGTGSSVTGSGLIAFISGNLAAGESCTFDVGIDVPVDATVAVHNNTTSDLTDNGLKVADGATDSLTVFGATPPVYSKSFSPGTVEQGETSTHTFTIDNSANVIEVTNLNFNDDLPAGMEVAAAPNASSTCGGGSVIVVPGGTNIKLSASIVAAGAACQVSVDVVATGQGSKTNGGGPLRSILGSSGNASATLNINAAPVPKYVKSFTPDTILQGEVSTLRFRITNKALLEVTGLTFDDALPNGVLVADTPNTNNTCSSGTVVANPGGTSISYSGGSIAAGFGNSCKIEVDVVATTKGSKNNGGGRLNSSLGDSGPASATLTVQQGPVPVYSKSFAPTSIVEGAVSTHTYTIDNSAIGLDVTGLNFNDDLPPNLTVAATPNASTTCGAGVVTAASGATVIDLAGGTVLAGATCEVSVDVTAPSKGNYKNAGGRLKHSLGNSGSASATLNVTKPAAGPASATGPISQITIVQNTDQDAAFSFSSSESSLNFYITTAGGSGRKGPMALDPGTYNVAQSLPAGASNSSVSCNDANSSGNPLDGSLTVRLEASESVVCTFISSSHEQGTIDTVNRFLTKRADLLLSNQPSSARRLNRLKQGGAGTDFVSFTRGDLPALMPFTFDPLSIGTGNYSIKTSLAQSRRAIASLELANAEPGTTLAVNRSDFDVWFEASYNKFSASQGSEGKFLIGYLGADYLVNPDLLVGALIQFDDMTDRSSTLSTTVTGHGWMVGPYVTTRLGPNLYFDGRFAIGKSNNRIRPTNTYTDSFKTSRWLVDASLTGEFERGAWMFRPNARFSYVQEEQKAYTDSLAGFIPSQTVSLGQFRFGPNISGHFVGGNGTIFEPHFTIDAIYNFGDTSGVTITNPSSSVVDGWRARLEAGVNIINRNGVRLSFSGSYDGIGQSDYSAYGAKVYVSIPFRKN
ncbi:MAG: autotransporter outer membrane beta-barrel domain-containing protein [Rhodobacteraceae bacterium]|nr:autotransporter outer membrane beta-barrel domain-containing protein [Paracoccaceae bacterium]